MEGVQGREGGREGGSKQGRGPEEVQWRKGESTGERGREGESRGGGGILGRYRKGNRRERARG